MASSCVSSYGLRNPCFSKLKVQLPPQPQPQPQATSQSFRDHEEENPSNTVDANMNTLRRRIEHVRMRERHALDKVGGQGWNYRSAGYDDVLKKHNIFITSFQLVAIVVNSIALVFLTGSLCIFLLSIIF